MYAKRQDENIFNWQFVTQDEPCSFVFRHPKVQLFLQGDGPNGSFIVISQMPVNTSAPICPVNTSAPICQDGTGRKGQFTSRVRQINHCLVHDFDDLISCNLSPDYTCPFNFFR